MKKNIIKMLLVPALVLGTLTGCEDDFLDRASTTQQQDKDMFSTFNMTDQVVNNLYRKTKGVYTYLQGQNMSSAADESKDASNWMASMQFNNGSWSGNNNPIGNTWRDGYVAIRQANQILEGIKQYNTPDDPNNPGSLSNRVGEVYFLRAWFLAELVRQFGGVILVDGTIGQNDQAALNKPRSTYDQCIAQIVADCDQAYQRVAFDYPANQIGRVTKGAALALKARMLLYSASPLWAQAGKTSFQADITGDKTAADPAKWKVAADASKAVIDLTNQGAPVYALEPNLAARQTMFKTASNTLNSKEVIWIRRDETNQDYDRYIFPFGSSGWSGASPTQNLVDLYETNNGVPITAAGSGYTDLNPYINRDPRFYTDITYNGSTWKGRKIEGYIGGRDETSTQTDHSRTGYSMRKLADEGITIGQGTGRTVHGIQFRLAEFYLSYAEALNEYSPGHADILLYVNRVRERAGQKPLPAGLSQAVMRDRIRNERSVELAFENHRFWDVRRWKIAPETQQEVFGMRPIPDANTPTGFRYERFKVESRPWRNAMYVIPITTDETLRNPNLIQSEGW